MNRIKLLREQLHLRQIDVAQKTGIDQKTLSNYETGKTNPDSFAIIALADFFHVTTDYLLGYSSHNFSDKQSLIDSIDGMQNMLSDLKKFINNNDALF